MRQNMAEGAERPRSVRIGVFDWIDQNAGLDLSDLYEQRLAMLEEADRAGFFCYHLAEHHGTPLGMAPSPHLFLTAAAQRTRRIRLGPLVSLLPLYHPIRLIEEVCMLDHMSRGRLELGVGRGVSPYELALFNVAHDESRAIFEEALTILTSGLANGHVSFEGQYFSARNVSVPLRPFQRPYPPLWYPTSSPDSVPWAARHGFHTIFGFVRNTLEETREQLAVYERLEAEHRADPDRLNGHVRAPLYGVMRHVYVAATDAQALHEARTAYLDFFHNFDYLWAQHGVARHGEADFESFVEEQRILVGSPASVRGQLARLLAYTGGNYFAGAFAFGSLSGEQIMRSLHLFADEIMPAFTRPFLQ